MSGRARRPRLGFLGCGWIGRHRLERLVAAEAAEVVGVADPCEQARAAAAACAPGAVATDDLDALLALGLDGLVIATPSALHADQAHAALEHGLAVFCQKPLARSAAETRDVLAHARRVDRLVGVDLSYRHVSGVPELRRLVQGGELGDVFAVDLQFHNAYGPDKPWFYERALSGGGCLIDLGTHLVDLALWALDWPSAVVADRMCYRGGQLLPPGASEVEDFAAARLELGGRTAVQLSCSWRLHAGRDAAIAARFYGTRGAVALSNVGGSFYDFRVERFDGTARTTIAAPPDAWGGRALVAWARRLADDPSYDPEVEGAVQVAALLDAIYGRDGAHEASRAPEPGPAHLLADEGIPSDRWGNAPSAAPAELGARVD